MIINTLFGVAFTHYFFFFCVLLLQYGLDKWNGK